MIALQRRGIVDTYSQFSFTRGSLAYDTKGRLYHPHRARFEPGKFGQAVLVEEGTTNAVLNPQFGSSAQTGSWPSNWVADWNAVNAPTPSVFQDGQKWALKVQSTGDPKNGTSQTIGVWNNTVATWSVNVYCNRTLTVELLLYDVTTATTKGIQSYSVGTSMQRLSVTGSSLTSGNQLRVYVRAMNATAGDYIVISEPQVEAKAYPTSFVVGTRAAETLTVPTAGVVNPQEGTVEFWAYVDAQVRDTSRVRRFFSHLPGPANTNRITIQHNNSPEWLFAIGDADGNVHSLTIPDSYTADGRHHVAMKWSSQEFAAFIDGVKSAYISNPTRLPSGLGSLIGIGCAASGTEQCNTLIDDLRISSRARTDEEIAAAYASGQPLPVDEWTTCKLPFDGPDAQREARVITL